MILKLMNEKTNWFRLKKFKKRLSISCSDTSWLYCYWVITVNLVWKSAVNFWNLRDFTKKIRSRIWAIHDFFLKKAVNFLVVLLGTQKKKAILRPNPTAHFFFAFSIFVLVNKGFSCKYSCQTFYSQKQPQWTKNTPKTRVTILSHNKFNFVLIS